MTARRLRWLGLLAFLGLLGIPLHQPALYALLGFAVFLVFVGAPVDERSEANLGRAATFTFVVTLIGMTACLMLVVGFLCPAKGANVVRAMALSLAALFALHIVAFVGSYVYFDARGA